jgi:hypothetical protein
MDNYSKHPDIMMKKGKKKLISNTAHKFVDIKLEPK